MQAIARAPVLELQHIRFSYDGVAVLDDVSLAVERGYFLGIVGPNGGGKSTLLRIALGLLPPASGSVLLFGVPLARFREWYRIGYVPQKATSFDVRFPATVAEVVAMGRVPRAGMFRRLSRRDWGEVERALHIVGMAEHWHTQVGRLSGGQQQRVFIARALAGEPELLVLDEPTVGIDVEAEERFYALLRTLNQELDLTLVLVSHDVGVIAQEVSQLACLNRRLVFHGPPEDFLVRPELLTALYGRPVRGITHGHS
ncbi:MAG: metal ABC transporter ATP-binding protein [Chloroflexi bacterium]|nr:metal ABC transporter ATP-binding protein [Chloroflexota bacterium]